MLKSVSQTLHVLLSVILLGTLGSIFYYIRKAPPAPLPIPTPTPTFLPTLIPTLSSISGTIPDTGWSTLQQGLERRVIQVYGDQKQLVESVYIWRIDQKYFQLDVAYEDRPKSLQDWEEETQAAIVLNGGYFSIENERYFPDGLTVMDGVPFGNSFEGFGGMLAIDHSGAEVRWLVSEPYNPEEPLQAALQSFPILVEPGGGLGFPASRENYARARRTVIGQDRDGRILMIVAPQGYFTLHQLSVYLTESDLNLDIALNLDGGGSTGILVANPLEVISPRTLLPFVILVYPR